MASRIKTACEAVTMTEVLTTDTNTQQGPYHPIAIANYFIDRAKADRRPLDLLKLIKLVYMAHGWSLYFYHAPLIDEAAEAWPYGPVIPSVYHAFKHCRLQKKHGKYFDFEKKVDNIPTVSPDDEATTVLLEKVWLAYRNLSGTDLSDLTHLPGSAWAKTRALNHHCRNQHIVDEKIRQEFQDRMTEYGQQVHRKIKTLSDLRF